MNFIKRFSLLFILFALVLTLGSCFPKTAANAVSKMKKAGYEDAQADGMVYPGILFKNGIDGVDYYFHASKKEADGKEEVNAIYFKTEAAAKAGEQKVKDYFVHLCNAGNFELYKNVVFFGTEKAVKDFKK